MTSLAAIAPVVQADLDAVNLDLAHAAALDIRDTDAIAADELAAAALADDEAAAWEEYAAWSAGFDDVDEHFYRDLGREPLPS